MKDLINSVLLKGVKKRLLVREEAKGQEIYEEEDGEERNRNGHFGRKKNASMKASFVRRELNREARLNQGDLFVFVNLRK